MWALIKKELKNYLDHPTGYILLIVFLVLNSFFYFRIAYVQGLADLRPMFDLLPWLFLFFIPAVTMRLIADERKSGTLEIVLSQPVKPWQILVGKIIGASLFLGIALALTLLIPIILSNAGSFDWGQIVAQYIASMFLIVAISAIGVFTSALSRNQVVAFISGLAITFFFIISGIEVVTIELTGLLRSAFVQFSLLTHFSNMARGVIDLRDVLYFVTFTGAFVSLAYYLLVRPTANTKSKEFRQLRVGIVILVVLFVLVNVVGSRIPGRVDLTKGNIYTLSLGAKELLQSTDDIVTITVYMSESLPPQIQFVERDVRDILRDFERTSKGNVHVEYVIVSEEDESVQKAREAGVVPIQFNTLSQQEFSVQQGYFGLAVTYVDERESIPFIQSTSDLEYLLASFISRLTNDNPATIAFLTGHGEKSAFRELASFKTALEQQYTVVELALSGEEAVIEDSITTLVIAGPIEEIPHTEREKIRSFISRGGTVFFMIDTLVVNPQVLQVGPNEHSFADFLEEYGVSVNDDLVFDLRSNESVTFGGGIINYVLPYPFWPRVPATEGNPITGDIPNILLPWASSINIDNLPATSMHNSIFTTTPFAGRQIGEYSIAPDQQLSVNEQDLAQFIMGTAIILESTNEQTENQSSVSSGSSGRFVVIGDSDFLTEQFVQGSSNASNIIFGLNAVDWLTQDDTLVDIRSKNRQPEQLVFKKDGRANTIRIVNMIGVPLLVIIYASAHLFRRRSISRKTFKNT